MQSNMGEIELYFIKKINNEQREESVFDGKDLSQGILLGDEFSSSSIQDFPEEVFVSSLDSPLCEKVSCFP